MFTVWTVAGFVLGAVGVLIVWMVIGTLFVTWFEARQQRPGPKS